ncbi:unnamed protein product [Zymoseptoria tritici ST99CH_3D7]|uniref:Uncharacterized protein n=1 Tax=Zymoseptoria tritici (strain ST99CH_3D7) TaxID=1276538 RepID=A0A1X7SAE4_ZYMT9|nr:unnamed protein product [Zymoseptoria tritici ST99CH_3D7]
MAGRQLSSPVVNFPFPRRRHLSSPASTFPVTTGTPRVDDLHYPSYSCNIFPALSPIAGQICRVHPPPKDPPMQTPRIKIAPIPDRSARQRLPFRQGHRQAQA